MFEGTDEPQDDRESDSEGLENQPGGGRPTAGDEPPERGAGARAAAASPEIGEDANKEQTQHPAPDDEVGVPENPGESKDED